MRDGSRLAFLLVIAALVVLVTTVAVRWWSMEARTDTGSAPGPGPVAPRDRSGAPSRAGDDADDRADAAGAEAGRAASPPAGDRPGPPDAGPGGDPLTALEAPRGPWAAVDLDAVRAEMPDNLYWKMSAPTKDAELLEWRDQERARWNVEYGKVLSNTATEAEIATYYAHRERLSNDYIEFASYILAEYGEELPRRDVALLKLAIDMHLARLEEIPRQITEALERREAHETARRAWLEEQKAFEAPAPPDGD